MGPRLISRGVRPGRVGRVVLDVASMGPRWLAAEWATLQLWSGSAYALQWGRG